MRVMYNRNGVGACGLLEETGIQPEFDPRGPIFSRVRFDGRNFAQLVKTEYLEREQSALPPADVLPVNPLDVLEESLPPEDLTGDDKTPALRRALVVAQIHQARQLERIADGLELGRGRGFLRRFLGWVW